MLKSKSFKVSTIALVWSFSISILTPYQARAWELNSENSRTGIITTASQFWVEGYGPVSAKQIFSGDFEDDLYWAALTLYCEKKSLKVVIFLYQVGSGHDELKLDDPGYISISLNGSPAKKYGTFGTGIPGTIAVKKDAVALAKAMLTKRTFSTTLRIRYGDRIPMKFTISDLSKARTRFKYAGCSF